MMPTLAPPSVLSAPQRRCQILLTLFQPGLTATTATFSELNGVDDDIASLDISATGQEILRYHQLTLTAGCIDSLEVRKKPGGHWIIRDLAGLDLVGLASL